MKKKHEILNVCRIEVFFEKSLGVKFLMMCKKFLRHLSTILPYILYSDNNINFGGDIDLPTNDLIYNFHSNEMLDAF